MTSKNFSLKICQLLAFTFIVLITTTHISYSQTTSWKGTVSTSWTDPTNWTNGAPTASKDAVIGDASFTGSNQPLISASANVKSLTVGGSVASTLSVNKNLTIAGDLTINSNGRLDEDPITITIKGNWSNSGTYTTDSTTGVYATATFAGTTTQTIGGSALSTFMKFTISSGSTVSLSTNIKVVVSSSVSGTLNPGEPVKIVTGDYPISVGATGILKVTASAVAGNYSASTISLNTGSIVDYCSTTTNQTVANWAYYTLKISGTGTKSITTSLPSLKSTASTVGNITVTGGTFDLGIYSANRGTGVAGGTLSVSAGASLLVGGTRSLPTGYSAYSFDPASTVQYSGTNQTINAETYGHLIFSSSAGAVIKTLPSTTLTIAGNFTSQIGLGTSVAYSAAANISFGGNVTISSGTTFTGGSYSFSVGGNWVNNGAFTANTSTVTLSGTSATISGSGTHSFYNLTVTGSGVTSSVNVITVAGELLTSGSGTFTHAATKSLTLSGSSKTISTKGISLDTLVVSGTVSFNSATTNTTASTTEVTNITLPSGGVFTVTNETLKIKGAIKTTGGKITATSGKVELTGSSAQSIPASVFTSNTLKDLKVSNGAGVTLNGAVKATGTISFGNVNNSTLTTNGYLTLASTSSATASAGDATNGSVNSGNTISGNVTVERYLTSKRAYRFLTAPVNTTGSIKANWMENTNNTSTSANNNPNPGYGTHITGVGGSTNGFDQTVLNTSTLFTFSSSGQAWSAVPNTSGLLAAGTAYRILIRGSRSTDLNNNSATPSVTTLEAKGTLKNGIVVMTKAGGGGTSGMPDLSSTTNGFSFIGNPYAAAVDWNSVQKTNVTNTIYIFDPTLSGTNGRGAYVNYNATLGTNSNGASSVDNNIQSGQAFFILTSGPNPSLTFREAYKTSAFRSVFRTANDVARLSVQLLLPSQVTDGGAADGLKAYFSDDYDDSLGNEDSYKFTNLDENIAIIRAGKSLSMEGRKSIVASDTLPLKIWQLSQSSYTFKITSNSFPSNVQGYLDDAFLNTSTALNQDAETMIAFNITSDPASSATDRFRIVFKVAPVPFASLVSLHASELDKGVLLDWLAETAKNTDRFEIEKSTDLRVFQNAGIVRVNTKAGASALYSLRDVNPAAGNNYYRIKSVSKTGQIQYSGIAKITFDDKANSISASCSADGKVINLNFKDMEKGTYSVSLLNGGGQRVYNSTIAHEGGTANHLINANTYLPAGVYKIQLTNNNSVKNLSLFIP